MINIFSLKKDYLISQEDGIHHIITWFLNLVMKYEDLIQFSAKRHDRTDFRKYRKNSYKSLTV